MLAVFLKVYVDVDFAWGVCHRPTRAPDALVPRWAFANVARLCPVVAVTTQSVSRVLPKFVSDYVSEYARHCALDKLPTCAVWPAAGVS